MKNYEKDEYEKKLKIMDENMKSLQSQIEMHKKSQMQLKKQIKENKNGMESQVNNGNGRNGGNGGNGRKPTGCCGIDGCSIM